MSDYKKGMSLRIKEERKRLHLTQEEIAEKLDISVKHFSEVERGLTGLSIENLIKLSRIFGVSIDYLVKGETDSEWYGVVSAVQNVPKDKEREFKELIDLAVKLSNT